MVISEKGYMKIIQLLKSRGGCKCHKGDILRYKKITYKKILCILVETVEVLFLKIFFASHLIRIFWFLFPARMVQYSK